MNIKINRDSDLVRDWIRQFNVGETFTFIDMKRALCDVKTYTIQTTLNWLEIMGKIKKLPEEEWQRRKVAGRDRTIKRRIKTYRVMTDV